MDYQTGEVPTILIIFGVLFNGVTGIMGKLSAHIRLEFVE